eukprot:5529380-Amphidinium_carterae.1
MAQHAQGWEKFQNAFAGSVEEIQAGKLMRGSGWGILFRREATVGCRTMLDALVPTAEALAAGKGL